MPVVPPSLQKTPPPMSTPEQAPVPTPTATFPCPKLRIHLNDLAHEGTSIFLTHIHGNEDLATQVQNVLSLLYANPTLTPSTHRPGTRSVTLILRPLDGVAYTTGSDLDPDHKEINFSLDYITRVASRPGVDVRAELLGVVCHELVHCFQWNGRGSCPGGLVEGMADWVRLRAGLGAKHWAREAKGNWDVGYAHTGFFLEWLEGKFGEGTVRGVNGWLREGKYDESKLWRDCCQGCEVKELWEEYRSVLEKEGQEVEGAGQEASVPTHGAHPKQTPIAMTLVNP